MLYLWKDLDPEWRKRLKRAWRILKAFIYGTGGVDLPPEKGIDC